MVKLSTEIGKILGSKELEKARNLKSSVCDMIIGNYN